MSCAVIAQEHFLHTRLGMHHSRRFAAGGCLADLLPVCPKYFRFFCYLMFRRKQSGVTNDQTKAILCNALAQLFGAFTISRIFHALAQADKTVAGHQQHILAGKCDIAGQKGAFAAFGRFLGLYQNLLTGHQRCAPAGLMIALRFFQGQKTILFQADFHKGCLYIRQNALDPSQKHSANNTV